MLEGMGDPSGRMLRLLSLLQTHRFWPGVELSGRLEVSDRTLRRDIERLRDLGYRIEATRGIDGGYRLEAGADLPPLLLEDEEAVAIAVGLRSAAHGPVQGIEEAALRALTKLEQVMPQRLRRRVNDLGAVTVALPSTTGPRVDWSVLTTLAQACRDSVRVSFTYVARDRQVSHRTVEPHRLVSAGWRWYLVAWDVDRGDWRSFRADRIEGTVERLTGFNPRPLPAADAAAFVAEGIEAMGQRIEAVATVALPAEDLAEQVRGWGGRVTPIDDRSCTLVFVGESLEWLAACMAMVDADLTVHEPPELVDHVRRMAARLARAV